MQIYVQNMRMLHSRKPKACNNKKILKYYVNGILLMYVVTFLGVDIIEQFRAEVSRLYYECQGVSITLYLL
jgi:hypothetical protein